jgi:hypothetical protein
MKKRHCLALTLVLPAFVLLLASCGNTNGLPTENLRGDEIPKESWHDAIGDAKLGGGGDSADDPIEISTPEQFALFSKNVCDGETYEGKHIALTADIDLAGKMWFPIGRTIMDADMQSGKTFRFAGIFDGKNHEISNMTIQYKGAKRELGSIGLFNGNDGIIKNTHIVNAHAETSSETILTGGIAGINYGEITNCSVTGYLQGAYVGGLAGGNCGLIRNCFVKGTTIGIKKGNAEPNIGGVGGFAGYNLNGIIINCFVTGKIGIQGQFQGVGGFVGCHDSDVTGTLLQIESSIKNCYGSVEFFAVSGGSNRGAFVGYGESAELGTPVLENNYYNADIVSDLLPAAGFDVPSGRVTPLGTEEMKSESFVSLLNRGDEAGPWIPDVAMENEGYPVLDRNYAISENEVLAFNAFPSGQETTNRIFRIDADGNVEVESSFAESE